MKIMVQVLISPHFKETKRGSKKRARFLSFLGREGKKSCFIKSKFFPSSFAGCDISPPSLSLSFFPYSFPRFSLPYSHFSERRHASTTPSDGLCLTCLRSALTLMPKTNAGWIESPWFFRRQSYKDIVTADLAGKLGIASRNLLWKRFGH